MKMLKYASRCGVLALLLLLASCGSKNEQAGSDMAQTQADSAQAAQYPSQDAAQPETLIAQEPPPQPEKKPESKPKAQPPVKKPTPPPQRKIATIPQGATVVVSLITHLRTDSSQLGDLFTATAVEPLSVDGQEVIPAGTLLQGRLTKVEEPHRTKGRAQLTLLFDEMEVPNGSQDIATVPIELQADPDKVSDEEKVAVGGVVGGVLGALTSKKKAKGAAVGAAVGAAAGGAIAVATKGKQLELTPGQKLSVEFSEPIEVPLPKAP